MQSYFITLSLKIYSVCEDKKLIYKNCTGVLKLFKYLGTHEG